MSLRMDDPQFTQGGLPDCDMGQPAVLVVNPVQAGVRVDRLAVAVIFGGPGADLADLGH
ncbi:MAG: hypothetical protein ACREHG_02430 [Candidatus Saccharimonadales bacterium]